MSTNLPRITQKIFAQNAAEDDLLQFGSVLSGNATPSTSIAETQTSAYQTGWRSAVISDRNYPTLGEMNAVQQVPTQQLAYLFQKGIPEWDASTTYFANVSYCQVNGVLYQSVSDNNIGNNPTTDNGTNWIIADLSNKITNCILSAPNGVATYSGANLTVKSGLKVLLSNGRNADKTLNNVEFTFSEDETTAIASSGYIFVIQDSNIISDNVHFLRAVEYYEQEETPTTSVAAVVIWRKPSENQFYYYWTNGGITTWTKLVCGRIAYCNVADSAITSLTPYQPVELAKMQDLPDLTKYALSTDIDGKWVSKSFQLVTNVTIGSDATKTYSLASYLPNDGNVYEVIVCILTTKSVDGYVSLYGSTDIITNSFGYTFVANNVDISASSSSLSYAGSTNIMIVGSKRSLKLLNSGTQSLKVTDLSVRGYRKVR